VRGASSVPPPSAFLKRYGFKVWNTSVPKAKVQKQNLLSISPSLCVWLTHTHTHTYTHPESPTYLDCDERILERRKFLVGEPPSLLETVASSTVSTCASPRGAVYLGCVPRTS
jgi:hypothetical protein